jgi:hypothetical protein
MPQKRCRKQCVQCNFRFFAPVYLFEFIDESQLRCNECSNAILAIVRAEIFANEEIRLRTNNLDCNEDESDSDTSDDEIEVPICHRVLFFVPFEPATPAVTCVCSHFVAELSSTCDVKPEYFDIGNGDDSIPDPYRDEDPIEQYQLPRPPEYHDEDPIVPQIEQNQLPRPPDNCIPQHIVTCAWESTCDVKPAYFDIGDGVKIDSFHDPFRDADPIEPNQLPRPPEYRDDEWTEIVPDFEPFQQQQQQPQHQQPLQPQHQQQLQHQQTQQPHQKPLPLVRHRQ